MTTQQPTAPRILRRRSDDRVIGGVASGLGDYFNIDPLLIRIGFVGLMVFGGMGFLLYVAAWILVPDDSTNRSIIERLIGRAGQGPSGLLVAGLLLIGAVIFFSVLGDVLTRSDGAFALGFALLIIVAGAVILRRGEPDEAAVAPGSVPAQADDTATAASEVAPAAPPAVVIRRPPRPRSPLGWYVVGAMLVAVGLLALLTNLSGASVELGQYFGVALGVIGIGLVVGAWRGHARGLILLGLLLLPFAWSASLITVPLEGGWGTHRFSPTTADEVRSEYRLTGGEMLLDLTRLDGSDEPIATTASVAIGELLVLVPDDAGVALDVAVGGGQVVTFGEHMEGTSLEDDSVIEGNAQRFVLDLQAGLGSVRVESRQTEGR